MTMISNAVVARLVVLVLLAAAMGTATAQLTVYHEVDPRSGSWCYQSVSDCVSVSSNQCTMSGTPCINAATSSCLWTDAGYNYICPLASSPNGGGSTAPAGPAPSATSTSCLVTRNKNDCTSCPEAQTYASTIDCPGRGSSYSLESNTFSCSATSGILIATWICQGSYASYSASTSWAPPPPSGKLAALGAAAAAAAAVALL